MKSPKRDLKHRGVMIDLARERSFHLHWMLDILRDLPRHGSNELHLYLENRFAFPSLPGAYPRGSLKPSEARILDREARKLGIRVIPHLNLLSHNENLLGRPAYRKLRTEKDPARAYQLNPLHSGTRSLLSRMIRDICAAFSSPVIHIGCDEAIEWKDLERASRRKSWEIFAGHVLWIHQELKQHRRRTAIWADMLLREPRLARELPKDIILFDWCYAGSRPGPLSHFVHAGFEVVAATSPVGCFSFLPAATSVEKQLAFLRDAFRHGATGHLTTLWELMRGYLFSIEYAFSLPVQWKAAGKDGSPEKLWQLHFGRPGVRWWRAAQALSRLQWDNSLLTKAADRPDVLNTDASQALTFPDNPFAFELKYGARWNRDRLKRRLRQVQAWLAAARRLPSFKPRGPLKYFPDDLLLTARRMEITLQHGLDWQSLAAPFAAGFPAVIGTVLGTWKSEYAEMLGQYRRRVVREGYGRATVERLMAALSALKRIEKELIRACGQRKGKAGLEGFIRSRVRGELENYSLRRSIHPVDLL